MNGLGEAWIALSATLLLGCTVPAAPNRQDGPGSAATESASGTVPSLAYSTYLGGSGGDDCDGIAVDGARNIYLACHCESRDLPGPASSTYSLRDSSGFFVIKLDPQGRKVLYRTLLDGVRWDAAVDIAVDDAGFAHVVGRTLSPDFPTTEGAFQRVFGGGADGAEDTIVAKLDPDGGVVYATYLGGSGDDKGAQIAVDPAGNAYVVGWTDSPDFPVTRGALQSRYGGETDNFVAKFDPSGGLLYSTYLGGSGAEWVVGGPTAAPATDIAVGADGSAYVVGTTGSTDFPLESALQKALRGSHDAFVAGIDPDGSRLHFSTYLGGSAADEGARVALDEDGNLYIAGITASPDFPTTPGAFQPGHEDRGETFFFAKLAAGHRGLAYSTYFGGPGKSRRGWIGGLAVDASGGLYVTGQTPAADFPLAQPVQAALRGVSDGFVLRIDPTGSRPTFSTYLGGSGSDALESVVLDPVGGLYLSGYARSTDFPLVDPLQAAFAGGGMDIVVLRFDVPAPF